MSGNLTRLKGSQKIRLRAGVMLGSDDIRGVQQTAFEIISNSIDRFKKGYGNKVIITRHKDNSLTIQDFADGLPMAWNDKENAYNWELALRVLYAGDNYTQQTEGNTGTLGLNGLGLTSTQMSSEYMNVTSVRDGIEYNVKFKKGRPVDFNTEEYLCDDDDTLFSKELGSKILNKTKSSSSATGTTINYKPDLEVFTDINIESQWFINKLKKQAVVNPGMTIIFNDELCNINEEYYYSSLEEYVDELSNGKNYTDIITFVGTDEGKDVVNKPQYRVDYNFAFAFNNECSLGEYYHNSSELTELSKNATTKAVEKSFVDTLHNYISDKKLYNKNESKIKFEDVSDSLLCVLSTRSTYTSFSNQTKLSIDNRFIREFITKDISDKLHIYLTENTLEANKIIEQILINKRANDKAMKTKLDIKSKLSNTQTKGLSVKIEGLKDCNMRESEIKDRILLLTEGLSASATVIDAIDGVYMGCYGLKGRFISVLKSNISDVLNNVPALGIINAIGAGIEIPKSERKKFKDFKTFDKNNARYWDIGILCDADCFGHGISLSLLTFFYIYMPELVKDGRIHLVISPRYEINLKNGETLYTYTEKEKDKKVEEYEDKISHIGILKGLGEFNADEFWEYVLSPEAREKTFIQVKYSEDKEEVVNQYFNTLMGEDIEGRKKFIRENIINLNLDEVE